jgi:hypothetical protein
MVQSFRDLIVWQRSMQLAGVIYHLTQNFLREEIYGLTSQIRRSAVSVPSNIAEGREDSVRENLSNPWASHAVLIANCKRNWNLRGLLESGMQS